MKVKLISNQQDIENFFLFFYHNLLEAVPKESIGANWEKLYQGDNIDLKTLDEPFSEIRSSRQSSV